MRYMKHLLTAAMAAYPLVGMAEKPLPVEVMNTTPIAVATPSETHMGARARDHVHLMSANSGPGGVCGSSSYGTVLTPEGNLAIVPFVVPAGKALVVTDVNFGFIQTSAWTLGTLLTFELSPSGSSFPAWQATINVDAPALAAGRTWRNERILSGVVFPPGKSVCFRSAVGFEGDNGGVSGTSLNSLYGYLVNY
jgi:hypothetical protein